MSDRSERFSGEYDFVAVCIAAIERRDYQAALSSFKKGLSRNLEEEVPVDGREFLRHMRALADALDASLKRRDGSGWGRDVAAPRPREQPRCSFCGRLEGAVEKIVGGPNVGICNECVGVCVEVLKDAGVTDPGGKAL